MGVAGTEAWGGEREREENPEQVCAVHVSGSGWGVEGGKWLERVCMCICVCMYDR